MLTSDEKANCGSQSRLPMIRVMTFLFNNIIAPVKKIIKNPVIQVNEKIHLFISIIPDFCVIEFSFRAELSADY
jgi:hypothetical protein